MTTNASKVEGASSSERPRAVSIRMKLFLLISALLIGLSVFFIAYFPAQQVSSLESALEHKAASYGRLIAFQIRSSVAFNDKETARETFEGAALDRDVQFLALYDESGQLLHAQGKGDLSKAPAVPAQLTIEQRPFAVHVVSPVISLEGPKGVLVLELSKEAILAEAAQVRHTAMLSGLAALAVGVLAAWLVGTSFARRIQLIAQGASAVARGDLAAQPLSERSRDEIGELATAFNVMLKNLQTLVGQISRAAVRLHGAASGFTDVAGRQQEGAARQSGAVDQGRSTVETLAASAQQLVLASRVIGESADRALKTLEQPSARSSGELQQVARFISDTQQSIAHIARLSEDAQSATEESLFVMQAVADVADETVQSSKEVVRAAGDLLELSASLERLIGGFSLERTSSAEPSSSAQLPMAAE